MAPMASAVSVVSSPRGPGPSPTTTTRPAVTGSAVARGANDARGHDARELDPGVALAQVPGAVALVHVDDVRIASGTEEDLAQPVGQLGAAKIVDRRRRFVVGLLGP